MQVEGRFIVSYFTKIFSFKTDDNGRWQFEKRKVSEKDLIEFCLKHSITYKYASALTGNNVEESFHDLVESKSCPYEEIYEEYQLNNISINEVGSLSMENPN